MEILNCNHITKQFGVTPVLEDICFAVSTGDKIGMMGVNGAGKTTLFKILLAEMEPDAGQIVRQKNLKLGYMPQQVDYRSDKTDYEDSLSVFSECMQMEVRLEELQQRMEQEHSEQSIASFSALQERYIAEGGLLYRGRARSMLQSLGLSGTEMDLPMSALSGGQRTRVLLAKLLLAEPDILLLDEPTNHLDIAAVEWLENFLQEYRGAVIVISHDRYFLDQFVGRIFELENHRLRAYVGNYSAFMRQKEADSIALQRDFEKKTRELHRIEGIIAQQKQWNTERSLVTARHKQKMADKLAASIVRPEDAPGSMHLSLLADHRSGNDVLSVQGVGQVFDGVRLFSNASFELKRGERAFLLGRNGVGKTTLLRRILGEIPAGEGEIRLGARVEVGYYAQGQEKLPPNDSILEAVYRNTDEQELGRIRDVLAMFLFRGEEVDKKISTLSGGEKARVALAILMLSGCNLLILDEPTNHLDIPSREILEEALLAYDGTILAVSHDRYFIQKLATRILDLTPEGVASYENGYDAYMASKAAQQKQAVAQKATPTEDAGVQYRKKRSEEAALRKRRSQIERLEGQIAALEEEIAAEKERMSAPDIAADYEQVLGLSCKIGEMEAELEEKYARWEELSLEE